MTTMQIKGLYVTVLAWLLCLGLMSQAALAQTATTFTGTHWSEFSYTTNSMTLRGARYACDDDDIDNDGDGLIEICYLEDLNAVRYVLDGSSYKASARATTSTQGCGSGSCKGYELVRDLDFKDDDSYRTTANRVKWTIDAGWLPIGKVGNGAELFEGIFEGNGHTLSHLVIKNSNFLNEFLGLFSQLASAGVINSIGLLDVNIDARGRYIAGLVARNSGGTISNSYVTGSIRGASDTGGLVGLSSKGTISNSYSNGQANGNRVGGLVGNNGSESIIRNSYSAGQAIGNWVGGLVGLSFGGPISNSYSIGQVTGSSSGGLVGQSLFVGTVMYSYWDTETSGQLSSAVGDGKTTAELQSPTTASDIYSEWRSGWDFGTATQYPAIEYTKGSNADYPTCGMSQQPACGSLLAGAGWKIKRFAIATQISVSTTATEGETLVLDANQGNLNYRWSQTEGTTLTLRNTNRADLRFFAPFDLVSREATTAGVTFQLTVSTGTTSMQQTVSVVITKVNNRGGNIVSQPITQVGTVLEAPDSFNDVDGEGTTSSIRYLWQLCSLSCSTESNWTTKTVQRGITGRFYNVIEEDQKQDHNFRVIIDYSDGQGYDEQVISEPLFYSDRQAMPFTDGTNWSQFSYTEDGTTFTGAKYVCDDGDIDNDDDGLIELCYLEDMDAVRHSLDGSAYQRTNNTPRNTQGCALGRCQGYELVRDLDFNDDESYRMIANKARWTTTTSGGWQPIGESFSGIFEGNGHTLSNLIIYKPDNGIAGLFSEIGVDSVINGIGLLNVAVTGQSSVGGLAGTNKGTISNSYSTGQVQAQVQAFSRVGGLAGYNNGGTVNNSYSTAEVLGVNFRGGLVGQNFTNGVIRNSYSTGKVLGRDSPAGGLVGDNSGGMVINSYSISQVTGSGNNIGGLVGMQSGGSQTVTRYSYWDITKSGVTISADGESKTTAELQSPTAATGIYSDWSDADWDFGTRYQYPAIKYTTGTQANYRTCGMSQQLPCGALLGGAEWQIKRFAIATRTSVSTTATEGDAVVLNASQGNFNYSWARTDSISPLLKLNTTNTAELWFVLPEDFVSGDAMTLMFELTVSTGTADSSTQQVIVVVTATNNGVMTRPEIKRINDRVITVEAVFLTSDPDGAATIASYQWQRCLAGKDCGDNWPDAPGSSTSASYRVQEAAEGDQFRVELTYRDEQAYQDIVVSNPIRYFPIISFTEGTNWNQFPGGARAVCDDNDNDFDIDNDDDGLIEICYLEDLNAVRYVLDGSGYKASASATTSTKGCGNGSCKGYELVRDLDFAADDSYRNTNNKLRWRSGSGWQPIGGSFSGIFEGNGYTLSNLTINRSGEDFIGLFAEIEGTVNGLGLLDIEVRGQERSGGLAGRSRVGTRISNSYSIGSVSGTQRVGGLVGENDGTLSHSYSVGPVTGDTQVGGLVGENGGTLSNSYSSRLISGDAQVGGLVGENSGTLSNSYSVGQVAGNSNVGGLVGMKLEGTTVTASYWDITTSNLLASAGGTSKTTVELQSPTAATGIYSDWSDADWDFGTRYQYPAIKYSTGTQANYRTCGMSQQLPCGALLAGAEWEIRRVAIATQTLVQLTVLEGEAVVLNASQGNFNYLWTQTSGTQLPLRTTDTAELWFVVPSDLISETATTESLEFRLTVGLGDNTTQQTVQVVVTKVDNEESIIALGTITREGNVLTVPPVVPLPPDADGVGSTSSIYQWQLCLATDNCLDESTDWTNTSGTERSYLVEEAEAVRNNWFRVVLNYKDKQGYGEKVVSKPSRYSPRFPIPFTEGTDWSQFPGGSKVVCDDSDVDNDDDDLIELCYLEDLDAIRYVLNGSGYKASAFAATTDTQGCASGSCKGYELVRNLDFQSDDSYRSSTTYKAQWTTTASGGWSPIGDRRDPFSGIFEGNGYTLSGLTIRKTSGISAGLFGYLSGTINGLGLLNVAVHGFQQVGGLVGTSRFRATISNSYSSGSVNGRSAYIGGLIGGNQGTIRNSYSRCSVSSSGSAVGGLVGLNQFGTISNSYSTEAVLAHSIVGGLVGQNIGSEQIINSYSIGPVTATTNRHVGGLVGFGSGAKHSYWDTKTSGLSSSQGGVGKTTVELQSLETATEIYAAWSSGWDFGFPDDYPAVTHTTGTNVDYPACGRSQQLPCGSLLAGQRTGLRLAGDRATVEEGSELHWIRRAGDVVSYHQIGAPNVLSAATTTTYRLSLAVPNNLATQGTSTQIVFYRQLLSGSTERLVLTVAVVNNRAPELERVSQGAKILTRIAPAVVQIGRVTTLNVVATDQNVMDILRLLLAAVDQNQAVVELLSTNVLVPTNNLIARAPQSFRIKALERGRASFRLLAIDGAEENNSSSTPFIFDVEVTSNTAPTLSSTPIVTTIYLLPSSAHTITLRYTDADPDDIDDELIILPPRATTPGVVMTALLGSGALRQLVTTAVAVGRTQLELKVSDGRDISNSTHSEVIEVIVEANQAPQIVLPTRSLVLETRETTRLLVSVSDINYRAGDSVVSVVAKITQPDGSTATAMIGPAQERLYPLTIQAGTQSGTATVSVLAKDSRGVTTTETLQVYFNAPPLLLGLPEEIQVIVATTRTIIFNIADDSQGPDTRLTTTATSSHPSTVKVIELKERDDVGAYSLVIRGEQANTTAVITVVARDSLGGTSRSEFIVEFRELRARGIRVRIKTFLEGALQ